MVTPRSFLAPSCHKWLLVLLLVAKSCLTLCDPMDCSPPGSSVHGVFQARILEWFATSFSRDLPDPGIESVSPAWEADSLPGKSRMVMEGKQLWSGRSCGHLGILPHENTRFLISSIPENIWGSISYRAKLSRPLSRILSLG